MYSGRRAFAAIDPKMNDYLNDSLEINRKRLIMAKVMNETCRFLLWYWVLLPSHYFRRTTVVASPSVAIVNKTSAPSFPASSPRTKSVIEVHPYLSIGGFNFLPMASLWTIHHYFNLGRFIVQPVGPKSGSDLGCALIVTDHRTW